MSVKDFHKFLTSDPQLLATGSCVKMVNILEIVSAERSGRSQHFNLSPQNRIALVLDAESCLDRLYGGYYPDWSCGGQWRHMVTFLATIFGRLQQFNVHVAVFLNGAIESGRFKEWSKMENKKKARSKQALRHISKRGSPPPKAFWLPPSTLHTMLRVVLRSLNVTVISSISDHRHEMMAFCWENGYHGVMADDGEIALFNPPRYFSAHSLKLSLQLEVITQEYDVAEMAKTLDLNPNHFGLLATLLGNHILPSYELAEFHTKLAPETKQSKSKVAFEHVIRSVVNYVRELTDVDDLGKISEDLFGTEDDPRVNLVKESLKYYLHGSKDGYSKHYNYTKKNKKYPGKVAGDWISGRVITKGFIKLPAEEAAEEKRRRQQKAESDVESKNPHQQQQQHGVEVVVKLELNEADDVSLVENTNSVDVNGQGDKTDAKSGHEMSSVDGKESGKTEGRRSSDSGGDELKPICIPEPPSEIKKTASERHRRAQMSPYVNQLLTRGEIKLPVLLEGEIFTEFPPAHDVFRPLRQSVYAVLFNLHHARYTRRQWEEAARGHRRKADELRKKAKAGSVKEAAKKQMHAEAEALMKQSADMKVPPAVSYWVREWHPYNAYQRPTCVEAQELKWAVPTVQRLWFGSTVEDKQKRLHTFMSCLRCDDANSMLIQTVVPQPMLLLACVLRYLITVDVNNPIVRRPELDALLVTAFSHELRDDVFLDELCLEQVTLRGVRLGALFMQGVEMAIFANDACGAPIPYQLCLPWTFFDGKLFHMNLLRVGKARNLMELCDGRLDIASQVERMRFAITEGLVHLGQPATMIPHQRAPTFSLGRGRFFCHPMTTCRHHSQMFFNFPPRTLWVDENPKDGGKKKKASEKSEGVDKAKQNGAKAITASNSFS